VSEALGDDLRVYAGLQGQGGMGVAQVVQADLRQHRLLHGLTKVARDAFRIEGCAVLQSEDEARLDPRLVPVPLLIELACRLGLQNFDCARVKGDDAASLDGLRLADHDLAVDGDQGAAH